MRFLLGLLHTVSLATCSKCACIPILVPCNQIFIIFQSVQWLIASPARFSSSAALDVHLYSISLLQCYLFRTAFVCVFITTLNAISCARRQRAAAADDGSDGVGARRARVRHRRALLHRQRRDDCTHGRPRVPGVARRRPLDRRRPLCVALSSSFFPMLNLFNEPVSK